MQYEVQIEDTKMRSKDRVFKLSQIDAKTKGSNGLIDARLFTGKNRLHAVQDPQTCLWFCKYDEGVIPAYLKQHFTTFTRLKSTVETYFKSRNVKIEEILD